MFGFGMPELIVMLGAHSDEVGHLIRRKSAGCSG